MPWNSISNEEELRQEEEIWGENEEMTVYIDRTRGIRDADWITKSDGYCIVKASGKTKELFRTKTKADNLDPIWKAEADLPSVPVRPGLVFQVWDKDIGMDDLLGEALLDGRLLAQGGFNGELEMARAGKNTKAYLSVKVKRRGDEYPPGPPPEVTMELKKGSNEKWGITTDGQDDLALYVISTQDSGPVSAYNADAKPALQLKPGDFITDINGSNGNPFQILKQLKAESQMRVTVRRSEEFNVRVDLKGDGQPAEGGEDSKQSGKMTRALSRNSSSAHTMDSQMSRAALVLGTGTLPGLFLRQTLEGQSLVVHKVSGDWRPVYQEGEVSPGHRIVAVNETRGEAKLLYDLLKKATGEVKVTFLRKRVS